MSYKWYSVAAVAVAVLLCCSAVGQTPISTIHGVNFSPYLDGQDPNIGSQITTGQITARLQIIAPYTKWVRTFASTHGLENVPSIARQFGLKVAANAWISRDATQNALEINSLIANSNAGLVDIAIVGSEAILRNDVTEAQLLAYMNQVRQAIPANIPVTTADVWGTFIAHPNLIAASDIVFANFYPYWEGTSIENAVCSLAQQYQQLVAASGSRPVAVSETGWPSAGNAVGAAVPSAANANLYALQYFTWAGANNIQSFYFEAFNESWKVASEGPQGAHWGIWDKNGLIKPGMDAFFNGQRAPVNCNGVIPGPVAVQFAYVPPYGSGDFLEVQVTGVQPSSYVLATYIKVGGGWWTKPTFAQPTVAISPDGTARIDIVTGGSDHLATDIAVFMIPSGSVPPTAGGGALPVVPGAVASLQVSRTQSSISGTVTDSQNFPIKGVMISNPALGSTRSAPDGKYCFYNITGTGTATLTVTHDSYSFPESPKTVAIPTGNLIVNFTGTLLGPGIPGNLFPVNGSTGVSTVLTLSWTGGSGATSHDVYFGASSSPPFVTNTTQTTHNPGTLDPGTTYYWRIVAKNSAGSTSSATWSYTTQVVVLPPGTPTNPSPSNGATGVSTTPTLGWTAGSGATSHDVHFGTSTTPRFVTNTVGTAYNPGTLLAGTTYYWRVVAKNSGGSTSSPTFNFTTAASGMSAARVGVFRSGFFWLEDVDGNRQFTLPADRAFAFGGIAGDIPITGDWNGSGTSKVGVYRPSNGLFVLDYDGDGHFTAADRAYNLGVGTQAGDMPVVGDWNGDGKSKVGLFRQGFFWILDTNGNGVFQQGVDQTVAFGGVAGDQPVVGDWDGDGRSNLGLFRMGFFWILDYNGNGAIDNVNQPDGDKAFAFGGLSGDVPVVGDWNGDGRSKVGVFRSGFFWVLDANGNQQFDGTGTGQDLAFPFGGIAGDKPVVGKW